ncbi:MAG: hypothetical protein IIB75_10580 [Proteobacteria bacterium]|nr:hypothetical protein [Pseudomonadota bacterium]
MIRLRQGFALMILVIIGCAPQVDVEADVADVDELDRGLLTTDPVYNSLLRSVSENRLFSPRDPSLSMQFDSSFRYIGGQKFVLYGVADTEQYFFVETTADNKLKSLYWVQFEAYLPDNTYQYDYEDSPARLQLNDYELYLDTSFGHANPGLKKSRSRSDGYLVGEFLLSKGYDFPEEYAYARLIHLTDASRRKELMIIFIDNLEAYGLTATDLSEDGNDAQRWLEIESIHLEKIRRTLTLIPHQI